MKAVQKQFEFSLKYLEKITFQTFHAVPDIIYVFIYTKTILKTEVFDSQLFGNHWYNLKLVKNILILNEVKSVVKNKYLKKNPPEFILILL